MPDTIIDELRKFVAPEFIFGANARQLAGRYVRKLGGHRVLLVSDAGVEAAGWTGEVLAQLEAEGLVVVPFLGVSANPRDTEVMEGAERFRDMACDLIVAVGGGSPMDCAKGIGIVAANGGSILDFEGVDRVPTPMVPLICIPTTGGTSADVSQFAIITDSQEKVKIAIISKAVVPDVALIDPCTLLTMDTYLTACTGMDALVHAIEAFVSNAHSPITDLHALEAIRLVHTHLRASAEAPQNLELRTQIMQASLQAGLAFSNASLGSVHAMAHSLGGFKDLTHGECNALLLPFVMDYNFSSAPERFRRIGEVMGCDLRGLNDRECRARLTAHILDLRRDCGIDQGLAARGIHATDHQRLASKAILDPCNATNPRPPSQGDLQSLYSEAM
ncbi:iron-containing alcohol dehydrogenase [Geothrix limicola]|uniref:Iron-containing alcohol dehydrogenase n=1 Tax=Geothrix limicola TaxID=2927978 RepID=A0ABQ5QDF6_9BACT|nr:alcohol dehydrogenase-like regulatory protein ErcA [Geothrix limicola]GLH72677.1 iron-containing alcohol dehydrogenase [Geothrix limicola]